MAWKPLETVTVYRPSGASGALGVRRIVTGSRHSRRPRTAGSIWKIVDGSTDRSSDPATGRSKATLICGKGLASEPSAGVTRTTRSGAGAGAGALCARETAGSKSAAAAIAREARRRKELERGRIEGEGGSTSRTTER